MLQREECVLSWKLKTESLKCIWQKFFYLLDRIYYMVIFLFVWQCLESIFWVSLTFFDQKQQKSIKSRLSSNLMDCEKE